MRDRMWTCSICNRSVILFYAKGGKNHDGK